MTTNLHRAVIALGSNLGDRFRNIELALRLLEEPNQAFLPQDTVPQNGTEYAILDIVDTSFLYETAPMYVTDQPAFINCACIVETDLEPLKLLQLLKAIEARVGRVPTSVRYGPRAVDLDVVFFDDYVIDTRDERDRDGLDNLIGELVIPHPRLNEREFVLRPLNDMIPDYEHPVAKKTVNMLLSELSVEPNAQPMLKVIPFPHYPITSTPTDEELPYPDSVGWVPSTLTYLTCRTSTEPRTMGGGTSRRKTHLMAIINVTPDSFSDGAQYDTVPAALSHAYEAVEAGASILDIGGYSTRPGATFVSIEREIARIQPVVTAIRQGGLHPSGDADRTPEQIDRLRNILISVDTFRAKVAEVAILNGANCVNDVYGFTGPEWWKGGNFDEHVVNEAEDVMKEMKMVARKHAVPVILMHSRAEAQKNKNYSMYSYASEAVVEGVRNELGEKVERVVKGKGGLRRWMVVVDVGIGFSKTVEGNLELLRSAAGVTADIGIGAGPVMRNPLAGFPQLIGPSRKSFLGAILAEEGRETKPKDRIWATAATVACSVQQEAFIVRVHDVREMMDVIVVSDAIWRS